jgi:ribosomal protein S18 acetylase RimI-like enzyme
MAIDVRPLRPDELDRACAVIGMAFADNPSTLATTEGDRGLAERSMRRVVRAVKLTMPYSSVLVASEDGLLVGVLNAVPWPHCQMRRIDKIRHAPALVTSMRSALPRAAKMMAARAHHDPRAAHLHIGPIGVHPDHQGRGVGTALLRSFLDSDEARTTPAFLETDVERNVVLYQRFGFEIVSSAVILGIDTRFMWRDPPG